MQQNYPDEVIHGITQIETAAFPDFDFLLGGFPCQTFSSAGRRLGFSDTCGTLFFEVESILKEKKPYGFILEKEGCQLRRVSLLIKSLLITV